MQVRVSSAELTASRGNLFLAWTSQTGSSAEIYIMTPSFMGPYRR